MFGVVLVVWIVKLDLSSNATSMLNVLDQASVGTIPGWLVVGAVVAGYALLLLFAFTTDVTPSVSEQTAVLLRSDRH
jgi:uncharacterized membrane protein